MKKQKLDTGDIFAIPLASGQYLFGRILFNVTQQCNKDGAKVPTGTYFDFFAGCFLIEVYSLLANEPVYKPSSVAVPGVFTSLTLFKNGTWPIVAHQVVNPWDVDFPEGLVSNYPHTLFKKGELVFPTNISFADYERIKIYSSLESPYAIGDIALHYLGRRDLIAENDLCNEYLENSDLRYNPKLRADIYRQFGEDPDQTYYQLALKHGLDLARLY